MHNRLTAVVAVTALLLVCRRAGGGNAKLLRFPNIWHDRIVFSYAGDLWTVGTQGGTATRLTSHPGLELFAKFSPDGRFIAFTGQYGGDEQVYVMPASGGAPKQLTFYPAPGPLAERWGFDNQVYGWTPDGGVCCSDPRATAYDVGRQAVHGPDDRRATPPRCPCPNPAQARSLRTANRSSIRPCGAIFAAKSAIAAARQTCTCSIARRRRFGGSDQADNPWNARRSRSDVDRRSGLFQFGPLGYIQSLSLRHCIPTNRADHALPGLGRALAQRRCRRPDRLRIGRRIAYLRYAQQPRPGAVDSRPGGSPRAARSRSMPRTILRARRSAPTGRVAGGGARRRVFRADRSRRHAQPDAFLECPRPRSGLVR